MLEDFLCGFLPNLRSVFAEVNLSNEGQSQLHHGEISLTLLPYSSQAVSYLKSSFHFGTNESEAHLTDTALVRFYTAAPTVYFKAPLIAVKGDCVHSTIESELELLGQCLDS